MPKTKEWQQDSFLAEVYQDIGVNPVHRKRRKPRQNPDQQAVFGFIRRKRQVIYEGGQEPLLSELTEHQRRMFFAIQASQKEKTKRWHEQNRAEEQGLAEQVFHLDTLEILLDKYCGDCGQELVRDVRLVRSKKEKSEILVLDYCSSCGVEYNESQFRVGNKQILK